MDSDGLRIGRAVVVPERELVERFSRSSGPGGQGVNTADSRVELSYDVARSPSLPETVRARMQQQIPPLLDVVDHYRRNGVLSTVDGRLPIEEVGEADPADVVEQSIEVGDDDGYDRG